MFIKLFKLPYKYYKIVSIYSAELYFINKNIYVIMWLERLYILGVSLLNLKGIGGSNITKKESLLSKPLGI